MTRTAAPILALSAAILGHAALVAFPAQEAGASGPARESRAAVQAQAPRSPVAPQARRSGDSVYDLTRVHRIAATISADEWRALQTSTARGAAGQPGTDYVGADGRLVHVGGGFRGYFPWAHAAVRLNGSAHQDVGLRYKGNSSFNSSSAAEPLRANFKIKLDLFDGRGDWDGLETLNAHAGVLDRTLIREALAYAIFRQAGVPAPRTAYADLTFTVPGLYEATAAGRFLLVENVNRQFLRNVLPPGDGLLMKPEGLRGGIVSYGRDWASYIPTYRPEREATPREQRRVIELADLVSQPDVALFRSRIGSYIDIDEFLRFLAVNAFIGNWDSYLNGHNVYLYLDPTDDRIRFLPWDEDLSMGARFNQGPLDLNRPMRGDQTLIHWLLDDPSVTARYRDILRELSKTVFRRTEIVALIDRLETVVGPQGAPVRAFFDDQVRTLERTIAAWDR